MINLIGISGKIEAGKDTVGNMIRYLTSPSSTMRTFSEFMSKGQGNNDFQLWYNSEFEIKKYSYALKQTASLLTGIPAEKFENQEFKKTLMGEEWTLYKVKYNLYSATNRRYDIYKLFATHEEAHRWINENNVTCNLDKIVPTIREFLQWLGTDAIRDNIHPNAWVNALFSTYQKELKGSRVVKSAEGIVTGYEEYFSYPHWIITDVRFPNEAQAIRDKEGVVIRVNRNPQGDWNIIKAAMIEEHPSETALDDWQFDYELNNNGTIEELLENVKEMLKVFKVI